MGGKGQSLIKTLITSGLVKEEDIKGTVLISDLWKYGIKSIVADASIYIHKFGHSNLCGGFIDLIRTFNKSGCMLTFVFDSKPPIEKSTTLRERKEKRFNAKDKVNKSETDLTILIEKESQSNTKKEKAEIKIQISEVRKTIKKYNRRTFSIKRVHITFLKNLFDFLKIPYAHVDNYEADAVCGTMVNMNIADACLSDDYDLISYNCKCILRNVDLKKGTVDIINLDKLYSKIKLNYEAFIYLIIMNGTDYSERIRDVNFKYIHSLLIQKFDIDEILLLINKPHYNYQTAYRIFTQSIDIKPEIDIINYKYINLIYRNINIDKKVFISHLNKYISDTKDKVDIKYVTKKIDEYILLFSYDNPYMFLPTNN